MAEYDLVVIGSGAAGQTAATTAVHHGAARVAIVERGSALGHLVNTGCIPGKFLLTLAEYQGCSSEIIDNEHQKDGVLSLKYWT